MVSKERIRFSKPSLRCGGGLGYSNVEFLRQAGCQAELIRLRDLGINSNGNLMTMETNNREVYDVIAKWLDKNVV